MADEALQRPSRLLRDLEVMRAAWELVGHVAARGALPLAPRGDGHGVLVLPGFMATDASTWPLRDVLGRLGYVVRPWDLGRNLGPTPPISRGLARRLHQLHARTGRPVSVVGVSLGGVFARDLAHRHPDLVRQVITLGSPFGLPADTTRRNLTHAEPIYRALQPWHARRQPDQPRADTAAVLPVPSTAVYTRTDGIVPWAACTQPDGPYSESVEVWGSHCGLGHNPLSLAVIADRLAQPEGSWTPFRWALLAPDPLTRSTLQRRWTARPAAGA